MATPIKTQSIQIHTERGNFDLRVISKDLVQVGGKFSNGKKEFPFSLLLVRCDGAWSPKEIGVEAFAEHVIAAIAEWEADHPNLFKLADRVNSHNHPLPSKPRKSVSKERN